MIFIAIDSIKIKDEKDLEKFKEMFGIKLDSIERDDIEEALRQYDEDEKEHYTLHWLTIPHADGSIEIVNLEPI